MIYYTYDGSFEGLLTAIYDAYYRKENPERIITLDNHQKDMFAKYIHIDTCPEKADKVYSSIKSKISNQALKNVFYVYLSELNDAGTWIYRYLKFGWKIGRRIDENLTDDRVQDVHNITRKIGREIHFMLGLIRFKKLEGDIYYAPFEPQYNISALLASHFADRMSDQNWVIHDVKRNIGVLYNRERWIIKDINLTESLKLSDEEINYQKLWKEYFKSIAIKERINPRLQKSNMPMKYWKYLVEKC